MEKFLHTRKWNWEDIDDDMEPKTYTCYNCGETMSSREGYNCSEYSGVSGERGKIYICHICKSPTYFFFGQQIPGALYGDEVKYLPNDIGDVYNESRKCFSVDAYTSSVLCCRKLLMNISCELGADEGLTFAKYIDYLEQNNHIPSKAKPWIDKIRVLGNDGTHKIENRSREDAELAIQFTSILLKIIYEMPGMLDNIK